MAEPPSDGTMPHFLFAWPAPDLEGEADFIIFSSCFGTAFGVCAVVIAVLSFAVRRPLGLKSAAALALTVATLATRAFFFFADPFHRPARLPAVLTAYAYGAAYPALNACSCIVFLALFSTVHKAEEVLGAPSFRRRCETQSEEPSWKLWAPRAGMARFLMCVCLTELAVQVLTDTARSGFNRSWDVLMACRVFYAVWGGLSAMGFSLYAVRLRFIAGSPGQRATQLPLRVLLVYCMTTLVALAMAGLNASALCLNEATHLRGHMSRDMSFLIFHGAENALILIDACLTAVLFLPAAFRPPAIRSQASRPGTFISQVSRPGTFILSRLSKVEQSREQSRASERSDSSNRSSCMSSGLSEGPIKSAGSPCTDRLRLSAPHSLSGELSASSETPKESRNEQAVNVV